MASTGKWIDRACQSKPMQSAHPLRRVPTFGGTYKAVSTGGVSLVPKDCFIAISLQELHNSQVLSCGR